MRDRTKIELQVSLPSYRVVEPLKQQRIRLAKGRQLDTVVLAIGDKTNSFLIPLHILYIVPTVIIADRFRVATNLQRLRFPRLPVPVSK